jgi:predicted  nucleic acid-binding Zn-ribbon protein
LIEGDIKMISDKLERLYHERYILKSNLNKLNKELNNITIEIKHNQLNLDHLNRLIEIEESK